MRGGAERVVALSGGVGGAKLALGLHRLVGEGGLAIIANTGDDFVHHGLHISPDVDTLIYTLAGLNNRELGWGREGETWSYMEACAELGLETWFRLGDHDLAVHVLRTLRLKEGATLSEVTAELCARFGLPGLIWPMSDDPVSTMVETDQGVLPFQEYFVRHRCAPVVRAVHYRGAERARPSGRFLTALRDPGPGAVVVCPSNPFLSILPILSLQGVREALGELRAPLVVVSPVVGGEAIKGPTAKMMRELGMDSGVEAIAALYADLADGLVIDAADAALAPVIERSGIPVLVTDTVMHTLQDRIDLAAATLRFAATLERG
ncbi:MAG: 2-phospho-L-lactate transferase [Gammaproteobacteria bacterium]|nr:MAG: 2-phospho-L-lactate transferase [Gammaproteobacteria bacterium]